MILEKLGSDRCEELGERRQRGKNERGDVEKPGNELRGGIKAGQKWEIIEEKSTSVGSVGKLRSRRDPLLLVSITLWKD